MPLNVGDRLGHYDGTAQIGAGGMGEVCRATDTQLNRQVALKILPEVFATDPDRLARFQREAKVLASLKHPGVATIYGIEEGEGTRALVLELVGGPTWLTGLRCGAVRWRRRIAQALQLPSRRRFAGLQWVSASTRPELTGIRNRKNVRRRNLARAGKGLVYKGSDPGR